MQMEWWWIRLNDSHKKLIFKFLVESLTFSWLGFMLWLTWLSLHVTIHSHLIWCMHYILCSWTLFIIWIICLLSLKDAMHQNVALLLLSLACVLEIWQKRQAMRVPAMYVAAYNFSSKNKSWKNEIFYPGKPHFI